MDNNKNQNNPEVNPYEILGIKEDSNFDEIQKARDKKVIEAGDDLIAKAKIESSYDQLLMGSLKARQSGSVSFAAQNASIKENQNKELNNNPLLSKLKNFSKNASNQSPISLSKNIASNTIEGLPIKLSFSILFLVIYLLSPDPFNRLILSLSTIGLTYVQIKSGKRFISALGWSVTFLSIGLIFGGLLETNSFVQEISKNSLSTEKIQNLPALLLLWIGIIFL